MLTSTECRDNERVTRVSSGKRRECLWQKKTDERVTDEKVVEIEDHGEKMSVNDEYEFYYFNFARLDTVAIEKALLAGENIFIGNPKD